MKVAAVALVAAVPAAGYAQTPSGDKMKDEKMMKDDKMKNDKTMKDDKVMKDDKMKKDGKTMDKMEKK
jgi:hypothetical protein